LLRETTGTAWRGFWRTPRGRWSLDVAARTRSCAGPGCRRPPGGSVHAVPSTRTTTKRSRSPRFARSRGWTTSRRDQEGPDNPFLERRVRRAVELVMRSAAYRRPRRAGAVAALRRASALRLVTAGSSIASPKRQPDGRTELQLTPLELIEHLAALIPPPRASTDTAITGCWLSTCATTAFRQRGWHGQCPKVAACRRCSRPASCGGLRLRRAT